MGKDNKVLVGAGILPPLGGRTAGLSLRGPEPTP